MVFDGLIVAQKHLSNFKYIFCYKEPGLGTMLIEPGTQFRYELPGGQLLGTSGGPNYDHLCFGRCILRPNPTCSFTGPGASYFLCIQFPVFRFDTFCSPLSVCCGHVPCCPFPGSSFRFSRFLFSVPRRTIGQGCFLQMVPSWKVLFSMSHH